jgi:hypothetical protein
VRTVSVEASDVVVRLTGWDAFWALRREVRIPLDAVFAVHAGRFDGEGWRLAGTAIPFTDIRAGRFRKDGRRQFVSFGRRDPVLVVQADRARGAPYDVVAIELPDADGVAAAIEEARSRV